MINTFHSSYNPPPVPPRAGYSKPQPVGNTALVKILSVILLMLMMLTFGGFVYMFKKLNLLQLHGSYHEDGTDLLRLEDCLKDKFGENSEAECRELISVIEKEVQLSSKGDMLIIQKPGIYFIYSQVTFSKQSKGALKQAIRVTGPEKQEDKELLKGTPAALDYSNYGKELSGTELFKMEIEMDDARQ
ncbi:CD40 ligand [Pimephales promelas]|nr:CD40 ligand [Pimephales promelas]